MISVDLIYFKLLLILCIQYKDEQTCYIEKYKSGFRVGLSNKPVQFVLNYAELSKLLSEFTCQRRRSNGRLSKQGVPFKSLLKENIANFKFTWKQRDWDFLKSLK